MTVVQDYVANLSEPEKSLIQHLYDVARNIIPETTERMSYGMPSLKYKNKSLVAIMANKKFISLYPFGAIDKLGVDVSDFDQTSGSIHFSPDKPISDQLLKQIILARKQQIDSKN
jgi:uncharacterized protein YdhG (YjbR/CyaY superfamily)